MNVIKNLLIICVLAAVVYGMYQALQRTNVDTEWPAKHKTDTVGTKGTTSPGGSLALSGSSSKSPANSSGFGTGATMAPPLASPPSMSSGNPPDSLTNPAPVNPYPSSAPPSAPAGVPTPLLPPMSSPSPSATLGQPVPPEAISVIPPPPEVQKSPSDTVRNLTPPPESLPAGGIAPPTPGQFPPPASGNTANGGVGTDPVTSSATATAVAVPNTAEGGFGTSPTPTNPNDALVQSKFASFMDAVQKKLDEGKFAEAQLALSTLYGYELPANQSMQITNLLDQLAGTVIYSRQHYLEPAYKARQGDTLEKLGKKYCVPWELLARINGLVPPGPIGPESTAKEQPIPEGMELKVVRGPFNAVVNLGKHELTLMLQNRYAGRFSIGVGRDQPKLDGEYLVRTKTLNPPYYGSDGVNANPRDPKNPLGSAWIGLTDEIGIHGTNDPKSIGRDDNRGTICVKDRDAQDLMGILSVGSRVTVVR